MCFMRICDFKFAVYGFFAEHRRFSRAFGRNRLDGTMLHARWLPEITNRQGQVTYKDSVVLH